MRMSQSKDPLFTRPVGNETGRLLCLTRQETLRVHAGGGESTKGFTHPQAFALVSVPVLTDITDVFFLIRF